MVDDALLTEQLDYYRARAGEYDRWWNREGRFDRGEEANARWFAEAAELEGVLERFDPRGDVLELACGTGLWTRHLVGYADTLTAVDGSEEVLAINRARVGDAVRAVHAGRPVRLDALAGGWVRRLRLLLLALARPRGALRRVLGDGGLGAAARRARAVHRQRAHRTVRPPPTTGCRRPTSRR